MMATGEVMSIGTCFESAMMKAVRSVELGLDSFNLPKFADKTKEELLELLHNCDDERIFCVYEALKKGITPEEIHAITMIDCWFINKLDNLRKTEAELANCTELSEQLYLRAKKYGYLDSTIERFSGKKVEHHRKGVYKMVDTCAAEYKAQTPIFLLDLRRGERGRRNSSTSTTRRRRKSWYSAPVLSVSVRVSSSTTARYTAYGR